MKELRARFARVQASLAHAQSMVAAEKKGLREMAARVEVLTEAVKITQAVAEKVQHQAHSRIAAVVSRCLAIFDEPYQFKILFEQKRNKTEARLVFVKDGIEIDDPTDECGGGVVDVAAFALRLACLVLAKPRRRRFLCLDEPFKNINGERYQQRMAELLEILSKEMGVQMLIVTDDPWLKIGKVIEL